jgi:hypothetical protein
MVTVCSQVEDVIRGGQNRTGSGFGAAAPAPASTGGVRAARRWCLPALGSFGSQHGIRVFPLQLGEVLDI